MKNNCFNPLVSIILPVYNTAPYLNRCMDSIISQTYEKLEIICVDDGSTDGSERILEEYAKKDLRIKVIHKKNGGESSARNVGLKMMTGQYIGFLDCDDWVEADMYEKLVLAIIEKEVDMVASAWYKDSDEESIRVSNKLPVSEAVFGKEELLNYLYKRDYYRGFAYMWNKLYKRNLFYKNNKLMLFDESLTLGGDVLYLGQLALNTQNAFYLDEPFYHYYQRDDSGCHSIDLCKRKDWLEAYKKLIAYVEETDYNTDILVWIKRFLAYHSSNVAELAYAQKNKHVLEQCINIMKCYYQEYINTNLQYTERIQRYNQILEYRLEQGNEVDEQRS